MGKNQKKKATKMMIVQKTCVGENEEDKIGIEYYSCDSVSYAYNGEKSESNVMDLEEAIKIRVEDQLRSYKERDSISKELISRMKEQMNKYQRLYDNVTNQCKGLEVENVSLKTDLEK